MFFHVNLQPPRSPDLNICDLSICNVLQMLQMSYPHTMHTEGDVIDSVNDAWTRFTYYELEKAFCSLAMVWDEVILNYGTNEYQMPHLGKDGIWKNEGVHALLKHACHASPQAIMLVTDFVEEIN